MKRLSFTRNILCAWTAAFAASAAVAQTTITFETLPVGTSVSNQFAGVTFSTDGSPPTIGQIAPGLGNVNSTSSGSRFLRGPAYGGDLPRLLNINFTTSKARVALYAGLLSATQPGDIVVQVFDQSLALIPSLSSTITVGPASATGAINNRISLVAPSEAQRIRRVVLFTNAVNVVCIDDLLFCDQASTQDAIVTLTEPANFACICAGQNLAFSGTIDATPGCGAYSTDVLEYRSATTGSGWTTIAGPFVALPNGGDSFTGSLYGVTIPASLPGGYYFFRARAYNSSGRSASDVVLLYVDRTPPTLDVLTPAESAIVGGNVCVIGRISDVCTVNSTFEYRALPAGTYTAIPAGGATFPNLRRWNTTGLTDGGYELRIRSTDGCSNTTTLLRQVTVDNTLPTARLDVAPCSYLSGIVDIRGEATDANLAGWVLQYTGGDSTGWTTIASGTAPVLSGGLLAQWDTRPLRACAYTLRLVVSDRATNQCDVGGGGAPNQREYLVSVNVGCAADFNRSGIVSVQDIFDFLAAYFAGCP